MVFKFTVCRKFAQKTLSRALPFDSRAKTRGGDCFVARRRFKLDNHKLQRATLLKERKVLCALFFLLPCTTRLSLLREVHL